MKDGLFSGRHGDEEGVFAHLMERLPIAFVYKGAKVKETSSGRTGVCIMNPDSDTDVKVRTYEQPNGNWQHQQPARF